MKSIFIIVYLITFIFAVASQEEDKFIGTWEVKNNYTVVTEEFRTDKRGLKMEIGLSIDNSYLDNPNIYVKFDFIDEDLLYIYKRNGKAIRGFYKVVPNGPRRKVAIFEACILLKDKEDRKYPIGLIMTEKEDHYQISYTVDHGLKDKTIHSIGEMIKQN